MPEKIFEWKGYSWMNGQPWGVTHTKPNQLWYADANEAKIVDGSLSLTVNNNKKYFGGDIDQVKPNGCGYISTFEDFKYGHFEFSYILPIGIHLWPAIWLSGFDSWPPEIDIVEGWSGEGYFTKNKPNYKKIIGFNSIHPGVFYGREGENVLHKGYGNFGTKNLTYQWFQPLRKVNKCDLYWYPDYVSVYYNNHLVMSITDKKILDGLNGRMYVCIDCAVSELFTNTDYKHYKKNGTPFIITDFKYTK